MNLIKIKVHKELLHTWICPRCGSKNSIYKTPNLGDIVRCSECYRHVEIGEIKEIK